MADPISAPMLALYGAGLGAVADSDNPLRGAALGGMGGYFLGPMAAKGLGLGGATAGSMAGSHAVAALGADPSKIGVAMEAMAGGVDAVAAAKMAGLPPQAISALANPTGAGLVSTPQAMSGSSGLFSNVKNFLGQDIGAGLTRGEAFGLAGQASKVGQTPEAQHAEISNPFMFANASAPYMPMAKPYEEDELRKQGFAWNNRQRFPRAIV